MISGGLLCNTISGALLQIIPTRRILGISIRVRVRVKISSIVRLQTAILHRGRVSGIQMDHLLRPSASHNHSIFLDPFAQSASLTDSPSDLTPGSHLLDSLHSISQFLPDFLVVPVALAPQ
jgi:hypothetical protein